MIHMYFSFLTHSFSLYKRTDIYLTLQNLEPDDTKRPKIDERKQRSAFHLSAEVTDSNGNPIKCVTIDRQQPPAVHTSPALRNSLSLCFDEVLKLAFQGNFGIFEMKVVFNLWEEVSNIRYRGSLSLCQDSSRITNGSHQVILQRVGENKKAAKFRLTVKTLTVSNHLSQNKHLNSFLNQKERDNIGVQLQELLKADVVELAQSIFIIGPRLFEILDGNYGQKIDFHLFAVFVQMSAAIKCSLDVRQTFINYLQSSHFSSTTSANKFPYLASMILWSLEGSDPIIKMASQSVLHGLDTILLILHSSLQKAEAEFEPPSSSTPSVSPRKRKGKSRKGLQQQFKTLPVNLSTPHSAAQSPFHHFESAFDSLYQIFVQLLRIVKMDSELLGDLQNLVIESMVDVTPALWMIQSAARKVKLVNLDALKLVGEFVKSLSPALWKKNEVKDLVCAIVSHGIMNGPGDYVVSFLLSLYEWLRKPLSAITEFTPTTSTTTMTGSGGTVGWDEGVRDLALSVFDSIGMVLDWLRESKEKKRNKIMKKLMVLVPSFLIYLRSLLEAGSFPGNSFLSLEEGRCDVSSSSSSSSSNLDVNSSDATSSGEHRLVNQESSSNITLLIEEIDSPENSPLSNPSPSPPISPKSFSLSSERSPPKKLDLNEDSNQVSSSPSPLSRISPSRRRPSPSSRPSSHLSSPTSLSPTPSFSSRTSPSPSRSRTPSPSRFSPSPSASFPPSRSISPLEMLSRSISPSSKKGGSSSPPLSPANSSPLSPLSPRVPSPRASSPRASSPRASSPRAPSPRAPSPRAPSSPSISPSSSISFPPPSSSPPPPKLTISSHENLIKAYTVLLLFLDSLSAASLRNWCLIHPGHPDSIFLYLVGILLCGMRNTFREKWFSLLIFQCRVTHRMIEVLLFYFILFYFIFFFIFFLLPFS